MGIYVKFIITTHQIWSCHVTLASNYENFYFSPNSILNFRKFTKFGGNWLKKKKLQAKNKLGVKTLPPVLVGLRSKLITLASLLGRSAMKVEEALNSIIGVIFSWILNRAKEMVGWISQNLWALAISVGGLLYMYIVMRK